jgi:ubiquinone/menaquinone biosynthesis C-methylase UbiE
MKTEWDYTLLADAYLKRPDYSDAAIDAMLKVTKVLEGASVLDVGAGVAHLTMKLAARGLKVNAVEPNDAMRQNGELRTGSFSDVTWFEGTGENTGQESGQFDLVTFGSSFNVCDRNVALKETVRILKPHGWFACMWNHRDLEDPIQNQIEETIRKHIPDYGYGARREDQTSLINGSGLFEPVVRISADIVHSQAIEDCVNAWRSHATLERQARDKFIVIVADIETFLKDLKVKSIKIPYTTHTWVAQQLQD